MLEMGRLRLFLLLFYVLNYRKETIRITSNIGSKCLLNDAEQESDLSYNSELLITLMEKLTHLES